MAKKKFYFNSETLDYEEIQINLAYRLKQVLFHAMSGIFLGLLFFFLFVSIIKSPREKEIALEKSRMEGQYKALQGQMSDIQGMLTDLQQRDDNLYRVVFQAEPIPYEVRRTANTNADYYDQLLRMTNSQIVVETTKKLNELTKTTVRSVQIVR